MTITEYVSLKALNLEDLKRFNFIDNYGFTFNINGNKHELQHVLNVYGVDTDFWILASKEKEQEFNTFKEALYAIEEIK